MKSNYAKQLKAVKQSGFEEGLWSGCGGIHKSPKYHSILSSGYILPKRKSNYTPDGRVRAGIAEGTKYERSIIKGR